MHSLFITILQNNPTERGDIVVRMSRISCAAFVTFAVNKKETSSLAVIHAPIITLPVVYCAHKVAKVMSSCYSEYLNSSFLIICGKSGEN